VAATVIYTSAAFLAVTMALHRGLRSWIDEQTETLSHFRLAGDEPLSWAALVERLDREGASLWKAGADFDRATQQGQKLGQGSAVRRAG
jgi:hypothetical protein